MKEKDRQSHQRYHLSREDIPYYFYGMILNAALSNFPWKLKTWPKQDYALIIKRLEKSKSLKHAIFETIYKKRLPIGPSALGTPPGPKAKDAYPGKLWKLTDRQIEIYDGAPGAYETDYGIIRKMVESRVHQIVSDLLEKRDKKKKEDRPEKIQGDIDFEAVFEKHVPVTMLRIKKMAPDFSKQDHEDALQNVCMAFVRAVKRGEFRGEHKGASIGAYFKKTADHECFALIRKKGRVNKAIYNPEKNQDIDNKLNNLDDANDRRVKGPGYLLNAPINVNTWKLVGPNIINSLWSNDDLHSDKFLENLNPLKFLKDLSAITRNSIPDSHHYGQHPESALDRKEIRYAAIFGFPIGSIKKRELHPIRYSNRWHALYAIANAGRDTREGYRELQHRFNISDNTAKKMLERVRKDFDQNVQKLGYKRKKVHRYVCGGYRRDDGSLLKVIKTYQWIERYF